MKAKKFNRLRRKNIIALKLKFVQENIFPAVKYIEIFPARRAGLGFATFFWKVAKKRNPNNPVNPV